MGTIISWTDETWNPTTGCSRVSDGCTHCYAEALSLRFGWSKKPWTAINAAENIVTHPNRLSKPYSWKQPSRVFVNSMSDLFHQNIPDAFIAQVFAVMLDTPQHTYQILTKRPENMARLTSDAAFREAVEWELLLLQEARGREGGAFVWPAPHIWLGTSVEDRKAVKRVDLLRGVCASVRFLSCEPLLEDLGDVDLTGIHWVIAGGESGVHMRKSPDRWMNHAWARHLRDQCVAQRVAFFFKQSSGVRTEMGTDLQEADGSFSEWRQFPATPVLANA